MGRFKNKHESFIYKGFRSSLIQNFQLILKFLIKIRSIKITKIHVLFLERNRIAYLRHILIFAF